MTLSDSKTIFRPWDEPKESRSECPFRKREERKQRRALHTNEPQEALGNSLVVLQQQHLQQLQQQSLIAAQQQLALVGLSQQMTVTGAVPPSTDPATSQTSWKGLVDTLESLTPLQLASLGLEPTTNAIQLAAQPQRKSRPKKFRCPHCGVAFSNNGQLKGHVRSHTGERPFQCDVETCGKTFTRNEELTRHKRIHTGLRPYSCSQCGKKFGRRDHLKKHTRTHQRPPPSFMLMPPQLQFGQLLHPIQGMQPFIYNPMIL